MKTTVKDGQSLVDIALVITGSVEGVWPLALRNGLGLTEDVVYDQVIDWERDDVLDTRITARYATEGINPATAVSDETIDKLLNNAIPETKPPYELIDADDPGKEQTTAQVFTGEFTVAFA